jgi:hypothetical protein
MKEIEIISPKSKIKQTLIKWQNGWCERLKLLLER